VNSQGKTKWMRFGMACLLCIGFAYGIALLIGTN